ncbi:glycine betaine ABC transporter substrate-binding protein [Senegalia massiliensis]|nr:glycine betaine ABC transporter substrate-binding protein [Senegalia massiliensis]
MVFNYMIENFGEIIAKTIEHMQITLTAVLLAVLIGVPLGIIVSRSKKLGDGILTVANIFQTIPSLAMFGFIIPIPLIGGIGYRPAVIVLFLYALLPIIKNTFIGIKSVDESIKESAKGVGMTPIQILFMVSLPLSFPVIMGGIRVATVINIGTTTIAALIGAGGLGDFIFRGISMSDNSIILAGAIPTTALALGIDYLLGLIEKKASVSVFGHIITDKKTRKRIGALALAVVLIIVSVVGYQYFNEDETVIVGTKNYTEARIEGQILSILIEENTDYETEIKELGGTLPAFEALKSNEIDTYVEYTGTAFEAILKREDKVTDPDKVYNIVKEEYQNQYNITWLEPLGFNNTYTFAVEKDLAEANNLETFSDLASVAGELTLGATVEFLERSDGYPGVKEAYGFEFGETNGLDPGLRYNAIDSGEVDTIDAFSTDGKIIELNLKVLEDDKSFFPPYYAAPIMHNESLKKYPELKGVLEKLGDTISDEEMQNMNYLVDVEKEDIEKVARDFLEKEGLI